MFDLLETDVVPFKAGKRLESSTGHLVLRPCGSYIYKNRKPDQYRYRGMRKYDREKKITNRGVCEVVEHDAHGAR